MHGIVFLTLFLLCLILAFKVTKKTICIFLVVSILTFFIEKVLIKLSFSQIPLKEIVLIIAFLFVLRAGKSVKTIFLVLACILASIIVSRLLFGRKQNINSIIEKTKRLGENAVSSINIEVPNY